MTDDQKKKREKLYQSEEYKKALEAFKKTTANNNWPDWYNKHDVIKL